MDQKQGRIRNRDAAGSETGTQLEGRIRNRDAGSETGTQLVNYRWIRNRDGIRNRDAASKLSNSEVGRQRRDAHRSERRSPIHSFCIQLLTLSRKFLEERSIAALEPRLKTISALSPAVRSGESPSLTTPSAAPFSSVVFAALQPFLSSSPVYSSN